LFVPLSIWVIYACVIRGPYRGKVVGVAFAAAGGVAQGAYNNAASGAPNHIRAMFTNG
jgi:hypothetical protein